MRRGGKVDRIGDFYKEQLKDVSHIEILLKTFPYLWPKHQCCLRFQFILSILFMIAASIAELYAPIPMRMILVALTPLASNSTLVHRETISIQNIHLPVLPVIIYGLVRIGQAIFPLARDISYAPVAAYTERTIAVQTFHHLQALSLSFHLRRETGAILRSVSRGAGTYSSLVKSITFSLLPMIFRLIGIFIIFGLLYRWYFVTLTATVIVIYSVYALLTTKWRDKYRRIMNQKDNQCNTRVTDALLNFETVKYFNAELHEEERYNSSFREYARAQIKTQWIFGVASFGQNFLITSALVIAMILAAREVVEGRMALADFVTIHSYILSVYAPLESLGMLYRNLKQQILDVEGMFQLLKEPLEIVDKPGASAIIFRPDEKAEIEFRNVQFSYEKEGATEMGSKKAKEPLIKNLSFKIAAGQKVAFVGASGAGKSTIARLLYRFYDVQSGEILINGINITDVQQRSLRQWIGIVPQDCVLFNDTIEYNIGYGAMNHDATSEDIIEAARKAALHDFIMTQTQGYQTKVGERGLRLSGGEKQRVAIARTVLKQPKIMIFDEATSSLDSITEAEILKQLDEIAKNHTSITIAHRLSTVMNSDVIFVLDKGYLVEQGTHSELLAKNGFYKSLWDRQERAENLKKELAECDTDGKKFENECARRLSERETYRCHSAVDEEFPKSEWNSADSSAAPNQTSFSPTDSDEQWTDSEDPSEKLLGESERHANGDVVIDLNSSKDKTKYSKSSTTSSQHL